MSEELKDNGVVTALSTIGLVFGLIGLLGSFIPCLGVYALYLSLPASLVSGVALAIAHSQKAKKTVAIVAITISLMGVAISFWQYNKLHSFGENAREELMKYKR